MDAIIKEWDSNPLILAHLGMLMKDRNVNDPREWKVANKDLMDLIDNKDDPLHLTVSSMSVVSNVDLLTREHQLLLYLVAMCEAPSIPELVLEIFFYKVGGQSLVLRERTTRRKVSSFIQFENTIVPWISGSQRTWCTWSMARPFKYIIKTKWKSELQKCVNTLAAAFDNINSFCSSVDLVDTELLATLCVEYGNEELRTRAVQTMGFSFVPTTRVKCLLRPFIWSLLPMIEERQQCSRISAGEVICLIKFIT